MTAMHIAEINVAKLIAPKGDLRVAPFFDALAEVNAAAERMPGFVWRLQDDSGDATSIPFSDDPRVIANVSVWESVEALERYVFQTIHTAFYRRRADWFEPYAGPHFAMWWITPGVQPSFAEGAEKLRQLQARAPDTDPTGANVFTWAETASANAWRAARCA